MITNEQFNEEMKHGTVSQQQAAELMAELTKVKEELAKLSQLPKNQRPGLAGTKNQYERLGELKMYGRVPPQQLDLAKILTRSMQLNVVYSEKEVFDMLVDGAGEFKSLYDAKQDVTYLFKYYRGLNKKDGKHFGFVKRGFLRVS